MSTDNDSAMAHGAGQFSVRPGSDRFPRNLLGCGRVVGNYALSVQPQGNFTIDRVQMPCTLGTPCARSLHERVCREFYSGAIVAPDSLASGFGASLAAANEINIVDGAGAVTIVMPLFVSGRADQLRGSGGPCARTLSCCREGRWHRDRASNLELDPNRRPGCLARCKSSRVQCWTVRRRWRMYMARSISATRPIVGFVVLPNGTRVPQLHARDFANWQDDPRDRLCGSAGVVCRTRSDQCRTASIAGRRRGRCRCVRRGREARQYRHSQFPVAGFTVSLCGSHGKRRPRDPRGRAVCRSPGPPGGSPAFLCGEVDSAENVGQVEDSDRVRLPCNDAATDRTPLRHHRNSSPGDQIVFETRQTGNRLSATASRYAPFVLAEKSAAHRR